MENLHWYAGSKGVVFSKPLTTDGKATVYCYWCSLCLTAKPQWTESWSDLRRAGLTPNQIQGSLWPWGSGSIPRHTSCRLALSTGSRSNQSPPSEDTPTKVKLWLGVGWGGMVVLVGGVHWPILQGWANDFHLMTHFTRVSQWPSLDNPIYKGEPMTFT